jgi:hypothetical protein
LRATPSTTSEQIFYGADQVLRGVSILNPRADLDFIAPTAGYPASVDSVPLGALPRLAILVQKLLRTEHELEHFIRRVVIRVCFDFRRDKLHASLEYPDAIGPFRLCPLSRRSGRDGL